jgi:hypothetical protein
MIWNYDHFSKWNIEFDRICTLKKIIFIQKELTKIIQFIEEIANIFKNMLQKKPFKKNFYEKVKMSTKGPTMVESFVTIGSFDCDCTHKGNLLKP